MPAENSVTSLGISRCVWLFCYAHSRTDTFRLCLQSSCGKYSAQSCAVRSPRFSDAASLGTDAITSNTQNSWYLLNVRLFQFPFSHPRILKLFILWNRKGFSLLSHEKQAGKIASNWQWKENKWWIFLKSPNTHFPSQIRKWKVNWRVSQSKKENWNPYLLTILRYIKINWAGLEIGENMKNHGPLNTTCELFWQKSVSYWYWV